MFQLGSRFCRKERGAGSRSESGRRLLVVLFEGRPREARQFRFGRDTDTDTGAAKGMRESDGGVAAAIRRGRKRLYNEGPLMTTSCSERERVRVRVKDRG